jgi:hypothetical protein
MRPFDAASPASALPIFLSIKMSGGFGLIANVSYSDNTDADLGWITRSSFAVFCAQTFSAELLSTNHTALMTAILCAVAVFSGLTTQPVLSMALSLIHCHLAKHMPSHAIRYCHWAGGKLTEKLNQKKDENVSRLKRQPVNGNFYQKLRKFYCLI